MKLSRRSLIRSALAAPALIIPGRSKAWLHGSTLNATNDPNFLSPFSATSLWKATPVSPVLGTVAIPTSGGTQNFPAISSGYDFGTPMYYATASDPPMTFVGGPVANPGALLSDQINYELITLPHFPTNVLTASNGSVDSQLALYDSSTGIWYTAWQAILIPPGTAGFDTGWMAGNMTIEYATPAAAGNAFDACTGFPTCNRPSGPRGGGTNNFGGLPRVWEYDAITAGKINVLNHAIGFDLDVTGLHSGPVFPCTTEDGGANALAGNPRATGPATYGSLWMLPPTFNLNSLTGPVAPYAQALARTFMTKGGYVIDQSGDTWNIDCEVSQDNISRWFNLDPNVDHFGNLGIIRDALREVTGVSGWLDANNNSFTPLTFANQNLISMRTVNNFTVLAGTFNTVTNLLEYPDTTSLGSTATSAAFYIPRLSTQYGGSTTQPWFNWNQGNMFQDPVPGQQYTLTAYGHGTTINVALAVEDSSNTILYLSPNLTPGQSTTFVYPTSGSPYYTVVGTTKTVGPAAGIRLEMVAT